MNHTEQSFRAYASWRGLTASEGALSSSFSNLRLAFSAPVADEGQPGLTSPEELLLRAAALARHRSPVLRALEASIKISLDSTFAEGR